MWSALLLWQLAVAAPPAPVLPVVVHVRHTLPPRATLVLTGNAAGPLRGEDLGLPPSPPSPRVLRFVRLPFEVSSQLGAAGGVSAASVGTPQSRVEGLFSLSVRADFIFGRTSLWAWGVGPFVSVRVDNFNRFGLATGLSLLLPVNDTFPLVLSVGVAARTDVPRWGPGALGRMWWGLRSLNMHSLYTIGVGVFAEGRFFLDEQHHVDVVAGLELDMQFLAMPVMAFYSWAARRNPGR